jgi:hypothetical protein
MRLRKLANHCLLLATLLAGCRDDGTSSAAIEWIDTPTPALDNIWPDQDGNSWQYEYVYLQANRSTVYLFETLADLPPAPSFEQAFAHFQPRRLSAPADATRSYSVGFRGIGSTISGATGPEIVGDLAAVRSLASDPVLRWLTQMRPDLAPELRARGMDLATGRKAAIFEPHFVHSGIWHRDAESIGYFNDLDRQARFRIAEADFTEGHEWSIQLIPSIAPDVVLHARVLQAVRRVTEAGAYRTVVPVFYLVEAGIAEARTDTGDIYGYARAVSAAHVEYAPGIGPVYWREWNSVSIGKDSAGKPVFGPPSNENEGKLTHVDLVGASAIESPF